MNRNEMTGLEGDQDNNESGSNWGFAILALLGLGGVAWYFMSSKDKLLAPRVRTEEQTNSLRTGIKSMYAEHGLVIGGAQLDAAVDEFLLLEKSMNSNDALKQIETGLSNTSQKGLVYGNSHGLYGLFLRA
ncbi:MAG: hypothetical protein KIT62_07720 [Cyclobacteriaceae bacterium]|nr:hypothetical protein [Cyclobacteriaceae bacterium]